MVFHYSLGAEYSEDTAISLEVLEARGDDPIWTWTRKPAATDDEESEGGPNDPPDTHILTSDKGLNRFVWDMRYPGMERFDDLIMWADMREGPKAVPGDYRARLTVGDLTEEVEFTILPDPRSTATSADYQAQFDFIMEARDLLSTTHVEIRKVRQLRTQLEGLKARVEADAESDSVMADLVERSTC